MCDIAIYFDNGIELAPFVLAKQSGMTRIFRDFRKFKPCNNSITLGFSDAVDSLRRLSAKPPVAQRRLETVYALESAEFFGSLRLSGLARPAHC